MLARYRLISLLGPSLVLGACSDVQPTVDRADRFMQGVFTSVIGEPSTATEPAAQPAATQSAAAAPAARAPASPPPDPETTYREGVRYLRGDGVPKDERKAAALIEQAAQRGHAEAQYVLAATYGASDSAVHDPARARQWLTRAAESGLPRAQYDLAHAELNGTPPEPAWAAMWYRRAAERGDRDAAFSLALMLIAGRGVPSDAMEAYMWLRIAERAGHAETPRYRENLSRRLLPGERIDGDNAATGFQPVRGPVKTPDTALARFLQHGFNRTGVASLPVDGQWNEQTRAAVVAYQRSKGLKADGVAGPATLGALRDDLRARGS